MGIRLNDVRAVARALSVDESGELGCQVLEKIKKRRGNRYTQRQLDNLFEIAEDLVWNTWNGAAIRKHLLGELG